VRTSSERSIVYFLNAKVLADSAFKWHNYLTDTDVLVAEQLSVCDIEWQWHSVSSDTTFTFAQNYVLSENKMK